MECGMRVRGRRKERGRIRLKRCKGGGRRRRRRQGQGRKVRGREREGAERRKGRAQQRRHLSSGRKIQEDPPMAARGPEPTATQVTGSGPEKKTRGSASLSSPSSSNTKCHADSRPAATMAREREQMERTGPC
eukprot:404256-Hanusia_phi.AAC.1